jgi:hypothetical protein
MPLASLLLPAAIVSSMACARLRPVFLLVLTLACNSTGIEPTEGRPYPVLQANATAAVNLNAVVQLERATGRKTQLIAVSGRVNRDGRLTGPDPWYYTFREENDIPGAVHQWRVDSSGQVTYEHLGICGFAFSQDLSSGIGLDSPQIVERAMGSGAEAFLRANQGQEIFGLMYGNDQAQVVLSTPACYRPSLILNRRSGALTSTSLVCTGPMGRTCGGPGVY